MTKKIPRGAHRAGRRTPFVIIDSTMIDWSLAERVARTVSGDPIARPLALDLAPLASQAESLVSAYTGLVPAAPIPAPEAVSRPQWVAANLRTMEALMGPVTDRVGNGLGVLRGPVRAGAGALLGAEIGGLVGYMGQRVLGQYDLVLLDADAPTRLLFVAPNLDVAAEQLDAKRDELLTWVALHEVTHALQFGAVPWLRGHLAGLLRLLLDGLEVRIDATAALKMPGKEDLRAIVEAARGGDLMSLVTTPEQRELIDRMQATMAVIEGHAEHVMDVTGAELLPSLPKLRAAMDHRRSSPSAVARVLNRLLGMDLKLRQYEVGKRFCDEIVRQDGTDALTRLWSAPEMLPDLAELDDPNVWSARVAQKPAPA